MEFDEWEPVYSAILSAFGYERRADERARDRLASLLGGEETLDPEDLSFAGQRVAIAGGAPTLRAEIDDATAADAVVAASDAAAVLADAGVTVDCVVTDLDGAPTRVQELARTGTPIAVHAHGDNVALLERYVRGFPSGALLPTTQAEPAGPVVNPGGFTDGDRAAFLADCCGADTLVFPGWEFEEPGLSPTKADKLTWAERLLYWLERRRGERFAVLEGRREEIDTAALPVE